MNITETLHARRAEKERGAAAVAALEAERAAAATAYASDMSVQNLQRMETADKQLHQARLTDEAFERRLAEAQAAHDAEQLAMKREQLRDLLVQADHARLFPQLRGLVGQFVDEDRTMARIASEARQLCAKQRDALERARELSRELGEHDADAIEAVHLDDVRVAAGIEIARIRTLEGRDRTPCELFLHPIAEQPKHGEKHEKTIVLTTHDDYQFAAQILETPKGKS